MTDDASPASPKKPKQPRRWVGFAETYRVKQQVRDQRDGAPWISRKFMVGVVVSIIGYTYYVYIVRFCVDMVRRNVGALGSKAQGVAYIVIFHILWLVLCWTYLKVILTPPGFARDYMGKTAPPTERSYPLDISSSITYDDVSSIRGTPYQSSIHHSHHDDDSCEAEEGQERELEHDRGSTGHYACSQDQPSQDLEKQPGVPGEPPSTVLPVRDEPESPAVAYARQYRQSSLNSTSFAQCVDAEGRDQAQTQTWRGASAQNGDSVHELDAIPGVSGARFHESESRAPDGQPQLNNNPQQQQEQRLPLAYSRQPPTYPVLVPEYRYCKRDGIIKPMRAHHCRVCGTCVLMYDHHCPWIGQCVGARNHKFFINFNFWCTIFSTWTLVTLVIGSASHSSIDAQKIVIIVLSAFFTLFTSTLGSTHVSLIMFNSTTVEHLAVARMKERERAILARMFGVFQIRKKRAQRKKWDEEWGAIGTEGNLWWLGSMRKNWEAMMGPSLVYWLFPIGRSAGDGLTYPTNPRFDSQGRWRRRAEWPPELQ